MGPLRRLLELARANDRSLSWAAGLSVGFFFYVVADYWLHGGVLASVVVRDAFGSAILFVLLFGIIRLLAADFRRELQCETSEEAEPQDRRTLLAFVIVKAVLRCVVGVSLILGWLAGLYAILERFHAGNISFALLLAAAFSLSVFLVSFGFVRAVENLRLPRD